MLSKSDAGGPGCFDQVLFVCAGSGLMSALLLLDYYERHSSSSEVSMLYSDSHVQDFICRPELEAFAARSSGRVQVRYIVTKQRQDLERWEGFVGRVSGEMLQESLGPGRLLHRDADGFLLAHDSPATPRPASARGLGRSLASDV